jgi:hypothetical protein
MAKHKSNEWEFQGQVLTWIKEQISRRPGLGLDKATQEPSKMTPKRSDLIIWRNRGANNAFFTVELKTPEVSIKDPKLLNDACQKAVSWGAPCFAIWNIQMAELYRTPTLGTVTPADRVYPFPLNPLIGSVDDWLDEKKCLALKADTVSIFETAWEKFAVKSEQTVKIEASVFVDITRGQAGAASLIPDSRPHRESHKTDCAQKAQGVGSRTGIRGFRRKHRRCNRRTICIPAHRASPLLLRPPPKTA